MAAVSPRVGVRIGPFYVSDRVGCGGCLIPVAGLLVLGGIGGAIESAGRAGLIRAGIALAVIVVVIGAIVLWRKRADQTDGPKEPAALTTKQKRQAAILGAVAVLAYVLVMWWNASHP